MSEVLFRMRNILKDKKGAVNSYRFLAIYIIAGFLFGMLTAFAQDTSDVQRAYDLDTEARAREIADTGEDILDDSSALVQANQFTLQTTYGDEKAEGLNFWQILKNGFLPYGFIPEGYDATELEITLNWVAKVLKVMFGIFALFEIYQVLRRKVT